MLLLRKKLKSFAQQKKVKNFKKIANLLLTKNINLVIVIYINAAVAQLVERRTENPYVVGSIPTCGKRLLVKSEAFFILNF